MGKGQGLGASGPARLRSRGLRGYGEHGKSRYAKDSPAALLPYPGGARAHAGQAHAERPFSRLSFGFSRPVSSCFSYSLAHPEIPSDCARLAPGDMTKIVKCVVAGGWLRARSNF